jgi:uncharacterized protein YbbC (DUF1343 family)
LQMAAVKTGIEVFSGSLPASVKGQRIGLLCNPASVDHRLVHARQRIERDCPGQLKALYAPQHGFFAEKQDNMIESAEPVGSCDRAAGILAIRGYPRSHPIHDGPH